MSFIPKMPSTPPSLLLLPSPPEPLSSSAVSAAYRPSIIAAIGKLKLLPTSTRLLVAIPCPTIHGRIQLPRSQIYDELQQLLAQVYSLICAVCAKLKVDVESDTPGSIDARIVLLDFVPARQDGLLTGEASLDISAAGPIVDISTLALTRRRWNLIFSVDGEEGQSVLVAYMKCSNQQSPPVIGHLHSIEGGVSLMQKSVARSSTSSPSHNVVAVGGTFDHLHAGHKLLLTATALLLQPMKKASPGKRRLIIGITGDELLKNKKYAEYLKSWKQRQDDVVEFLLSILLFTRTPIEEAIQITSLDNPGPNGKAIHTTLKDCSITIECVQIQDPFGPTITDEDVTALVVSGETRSGGQAVNEKRTEKGWNALEVFEIDVLDAEDSTESAADGDNFASKISSTAIRKRKAETVSAALL